MEADFQNPYAKHTFVGKREGENIIKIIRRHWIVLVINYLPIVLFLGLFGVWLALKEGFMAFVGLEDDLFVNLVENIILIFSWLIIFIIWVNYYLDTWIITDQRIVSIDQLGLFRRSVSELEYSKIQDLTSEVQGIFATLLNFGNLYVQTAGEKARFEFLQVANPVGVRCLIMELQKKVILEEKKKDGAIMRGKY